jgi:simple sugar transport system permease protein
VPLPFILSNAVVLAVPISLGALGGVMSERVGVVNIAIEGQLLTGAFVAAVVGSLTDNLWLGLIAAAIASALISKIN